MEIKLTPQVRDGRLTISRKGEVFTINSKKYDFSPLPEGGSLPSSAIDCEFIVSNVTRINGELSLTLILPIGVYATPEECFPEPIINPPNGKIKLPGGLQ